MKKILLIIFMTFVLAGCTLQGSVKMKDNELFEKKKECAGYRDKAISMIKEYDDEIIKVEKDQGVDYLKHERYLGEIFYSPIKNSCLYSVNVIEEADGITSNFYIFRDLFDEEYDEGIVIPDENGKLDNERSFIAYKKKLQELKGE